VLAKTIRSLMAVSALLVSIPAFADILSTTGSVSVSSGAIQFYPLGGSAGTFNIGPPETGIFSTLTGTSGAILNLNSLVVNSPIDIPDFMTFAGAPNLSITLTELVGSSSPVCTVALAAAGKPCNPAGTPYSLSTQSASSSIASAAIDGYLVNSNTPGVMSPLTGIFTTQFAGMNYQSLISQIESGNSIASTYSAEFVTATPEPSTIALLLAGLTMFVLVGAKRFRNSA
jgi:hypothetical protein